MCSCGWSRVLHDAKVQLRLGVWFAAYSASYGQALVTVIVRVARDIVIQLTFGPQADGFGDPPDSRVACPPPLPPLRDSCHYEVHRDRDRYAKITCRTGLHRR